MISTKRFAKAVLIVTVMMLTGWITAPGYAITFPDGCITNNDVSDCSIGDQFSVSVTSGPDAGQVTFTFSNSGPEASSITDIYFDDGTLLGIATIIDGSGTDFEQLASPGDLPGGNPAGFETTAGFSADSESPTQPNGVNPGESVAIVFNLQSGGTLQDVLDELASGELKIGIHVQGYEGGGSESFVCCTDTPPDGSVPESSTLLLLGAGLIAISRFTRKINS